jgi:hypothetical protein
MKQFLTLVFIIFSFPLFSQVSIGATASIENYFTVEEDQKIGREVVEGTLQDLPAYDYSYGVVLSYDDELSETLSYRISVTGSRIHYSDAHYLVSTNEANYLGSASFAFNWGTSNLYLVTSASMNYTTLLQSLFLQGSVGVEYKLSAGPVDFLVSAKAAYNLANVSREYDSRLLLNNQAFLTTASVTARYNF